MDIEGAEFHLLNPDQNPALLICDILVEVHDRPSDTTILDCLIVRFEQTHQLTIIPAEASDEGLSNKYTHILPRSSLPLALNEARGILAK